MITAEQDELLRKVGPKTAGGDWLRHYWWPIAMAADLTDRPTWVRVLGEDLVLFRSTGNKLGLVGAYCAHRCANLAFGTVEADGLRCRYHGWKFDPDGAILEIPGQSSSEKVMRRVRQKSYRVVEAGGLILAYLGKDPAPLLPQYDFLVGEGDRDGEVLGVSKASWIRWAEQDMDPNHVAFLHSDVGGMSDVRTVPSKIAFVETPHGFIHQAWRPGVEPGTTLYREHHHLFPLIGVTGAGQRRIEGGSGPTAVGILWVTPVDDEQSLIFYYVYKPAANTGRIIKNPASYKGDGRLAPIAVAPFVEYQNRGAIALGYTMPASVIAQDSVLIENLGPISGNENLVGGDEGVTKLRRRYLKDIEAVKSGADPTGVFRVPGLVEAHGVERILKDVPAAEPALA